MTRIGSATLRLEGRFTVRWVPELERAREAVAIDRLRLDLSQVTYIDAAGLEAIGRLLREGAVVIESSPFVRELLKEVSR